MPSTTRLVDVPIRVSVPPSTAAIDSGISSFFALTPVTSESFIMIGINTTTTGVLLRKAEATSAPYHQLPMVALVEAAAAPHQRDGVAIEITDRKSTRLNSSP